MIKERRFFLKLDEKEMNIKYLVREDPYGWRQRKITKK